MPVGYIHIDRRDAKRMEKAAMNALLDLLCELQIEEEEYESEDDQCVLTVRGAQIKPGEHYNVVVVDRKNGSIVATLVVLPVEAGSLLRSGVTA